MACLETCSACLRARITKALRGTSTICQDAPRSTSLMACWRSHSPESFRTAVCHAHDTHSGH
eukprot:9638613-Alexandrium_andersonii.AAC.1